MLPKRFINSGLTLFIGLLIGVSLNAAFQTVHAVTYKPGEIRDYIPTLTGGTTEEGTLDCGYWTWHSYLFSIFSDETGTSTYDGYYSVISKYRINLHSDFVEHVDLDSMECSTPFADSDGSIIWIGCDEDYYEIEYNEGDGDINLRVDTSLTNNGDGTYTVLWEYSDPNTNDSEPSTKPWLTDIAPYDDSFREYLAFTEADGVQNGDTATSDAELFRHIYGVNTPYPGSLPSTWSYYDIADNPSIDFDNNTWYTDGDMVRTTFQDCPSCADLDITSPLFIDAANAESDINLVIDTADQNGDDWEGEYTYTVYQGDGSTLASTCNVNANHFGLSGSNPKTTSDTDVWIVGCEEEDIIEGLLIYIEDPDYNPPCEDQLLVEPYCGDGYLDRWGYDNIKGTHDDEDCDDGNKVNGDGCDEYCNVEEAPLACTELIITEPATLDVETIEGVWTDVVIEVDDQNGDAWDGEYIYTAYLGDGATLATSCEFSAGWFAEMNAGLGLGSNPITTDDESVILFGCDEADLINGIVIRAEESDPQYVPPCEDELSAAPGCGDGYWDEDGPDNTTGTDDDEECDDGNDVNGDGCDNNCTTSEGGNYCFDLEITSGDDIDYENFDEIHEITIDVEGSDGNDWQFGEYEYTANQGDGGLASTCQFALTEADANNDIGENPLTTSQETVWLFGCEESDYLHDGLVIHVEELHYPDPEECVDELAIGPFCGDGYLDEGEECDDGNDEDGDGCDSDCNDEDKPDDDNGGGGGGGGGGGSTDYCVDLEVDPAPGVIDDTVPIDFTVHAVGEHNSAWTKEDANVDYLYRWTSNDPDGEFTSDEGIDCTDDSTEEVCYETNDEEVTYDTSDGIVDPDTEITVHAYFDYNSLSQDCVEEWTFEQAPAEVEDDLKKTVNTYNFGFAQVDSSVIRNDGFGSVYGHDYDYAFYELVYNRDEDGNHDSVVIYDDIANGIEGSYADGSDVPNFGEDKDEVVQYIAQSGDPHQVTSWVGEIVDDYDNSGIGLEFSVHRFTDNGSGAAFSEDIDACVEIPDASTGDDYGNEVCYRKDSSIFNTSGLKLENVDELDEEDLLVIRYLGKVDNGNFDCGEDHPNNCPVIQFINTATTDTGAEGEATITIICPYMLTRNAGDVFFEEELLEGYDLSCYYDFEYNTDGLVFLRTSVEEVYNDTCNNIVSGSENDLISRFSSYICEMLTDVENISEALQRTWESSTIEEEVTDVNVEAVTRYSEELSGGDEFILSDFAYLEYLGGELLTNPKQNVYTIEDADLRINAYNNPDSKGGTVTIPCGAYSFIVSGGDLYIDSNIQYTTDPTCNSENLTDLSSMPSVAFIVIGGDIIIDHTSVFEGGGVTEIVGVYYIQEVDGEGGSMTSDWTDPFTKLEIFGSVYGDIETLLEQRTFSGPANYDMGNVVIRYDERVMLNTPPGLEEFVDVSSEEVAR